MRTAGSRRRWLAAVACVAAIAGLWLLTSEGTVDPVVAAPRAVATVPAAATPAPTPEPISAATAATPADPQSDLPPGVSRAQWAALEAELSARPEGPAELGRMRAYLHWADTLRRFREARRAGATGADMAALAQALDAGLSERIRHAEVSAAEARQIEGAILELTLPDEAERAERLRQWAAAELTPAPTADPRQVAFERRQGEIVAAWSSLPPAARDRAALERELEVLRHQSFSTSGTR